MKCVTAIQIRQQERFVFKIFYYLRQELNANNLLWGCTDKIISCEIVILDFFKYAKGCEMIFIAIYENDVLIASLVLKKAESSRQDLRRLTYSRQWAHRLVCVNTNTSKNWCNDLRWGTLATCWIVEVNCQERKTEERWIRYRSTRSNISFEGSNLE